MSPPSHERVHHLFEAQIVPDVWPGHTLRKLERLRASLRPGRRCVASYAVHLEKPDPSDPEFVTLTWAPFERLKKIHRKQYDDRDERAPGGAFLLDDEGCLVEVFPADRKVPALREAMSLDDLDAETGPSAVRRVRVLRYRAHRSAVLRYDSDDGAVIGKVYRTAAVAAEVRRKLERLGPQANDRGLAIPRCVGRSRLGEIVLMERMRGDSFARRLEDAPDAGAAKELIRIAVQAIAAFRSMCLEDGTPRTLSGDVEGLASRASRLASAGPSLVGDLDHLLARLRAGSAELPARPAVLIHGDFKPDQLLLVEGRVGVVDLDHVGAGDGAIDVGNFGAVLEHRALELDRVELRSLAEEFLRQVVHKTRDELLGRAARLGLVVALARRAVKVLERDLARGLVVGEERPGRRLLQRAERLLTAWEAQ